MLFLLFYAAASWCSNESQFYEKSMQLCYEFPSCRDAFYLTHSFDDGERFVHQLELLMFENQVDADLACQSEDLWVRLMANFWPCAMSQYYDKRLGCVCKPDKSCQEKTPEDFTVGSIVYVAFGFIIIVFVYYYGSKSIQKLKSITS